MLGETISHYRIEAELGRGGMGVVYRAHDQRLRRDVALKLLPGELSADEAARERLLHEARTASQLNHPHICVIHEVGEAEGQAYIAMELVEGRPLAGLVPSEGLPAEKVVRYGIQLADALAHAHQRRVIHRDLKTSNVMVTPEGRAKILDFGLARQLRSEERAEATRSQQSLEAAGGLAGTLAYMPPEVLRGDEPGASGDIWALGVVLYELAAGRLPFEGRTGFALSSAILQQAPRPLPEKTGAGLRSVIQRCLEKDPGQRYQSAGEVRAALEALQSDRPETARVADLPAARAARRGWVVAAIGAAVLALAAAVAFDLGGLRSRFSGGPASQKIESVAVLPLENLSGDPQQDYFADGMTEALISNLAQIHTLRVISRTTVMRYKNARKPLPEIARELGVDAVMAGSVIRSGERVRVSAQLIEAATDRHLWARQYDRDLRDILALQSEVARAVAAEIQAEVSPEVHARLAASRSVNPEAYDAFLRGQALSRRENRDDNAAAIELLEKAVRLDPNSAEAHAELARAYRIRGFQFSPQEPEWDQKALETVNRGLALDPRSAEAHLARGTLVWAPAHGFQHEEAIREFRRAIELSPSLDEAHHQLGLVYLHVGLLDQAQRAAEEAVRLNPGNTLALYRTGVVKLYQGRYQQAMDVFSRIPSDFNPALVAYQNAWTLFYLGRKNEAQKTAESYLAAHPEDVGGLLTSVQALLAADAGDARRAEEKAQAAARLGKGYGHFHHTAYNIGTAYALLKRPGEAVRWLEAAANDGLPCYPLFARDPNLDTIRQDPRFTAFLAKQKALWEKYQKL
jgi:TolB-like protein/Tfp pilus assembly protein PilF